MFNALFHGGPLMPEQRPFNTQLRCYSAPFFEGADSHKINELNHGGKILLPSSALDWLVRLNIQYPMMFKITNTNPESQRVTHCGVLEFLAEEGRCYLPSWMMRQLLLAEGDVAQVQYISLPMATYAKFKPQSSDFLNISNPRAVLEVELRKFACLTKGDLIAVLYNDQVLEFLVQEVKPGKAVAIIECDMNVEFDAPEGYVEPTSHRPSHAPSSKPPAPEQTMVVPDKRFAAFTGAGQRLDGKTKTQEQTEKAPLKGTVESLPIVVDTDYKPGQLTFIRYDYKQRDLTLKNAKGSDAGGTGAAVGGITPFHGEGHTLRGSRKR